MRAPLCRVEEIPEEGAIPLDFFGREVLALKVGGQPKAILNFCQHLGGPLTRQGDRLVCGWHGAEFACADGACRKGPAGADSSVITLPTRVEDGVLTYVYGE